MVLSAGINALVELLILIVPFPSSFWKVLYFFLNSISLMILRRSVSKHSRSSFRGGHFLDLNLNEFLSSGVLVWSSFLS